MKDISNHERGFVVRISLPSLYVTSFTYGELKF